jgi:dihydrofolate reductase/thymidylate synthase
MMRFDLKKSFPLLTTKRVFWRGVLEELLWFVAGDTNAKHLTDKGVKIWDANGSREFLDKRGLSHREEGDLGPVYGFQWRHFGAKYVDMHTDYTGQGVDQLAECIRKIKEDPTDRRILLSAWNPADLGQMALPPCHMFCQFYVAKGEVSCLMYQRSCDVGLGVPFNIASYALLTLMVAQVCGLKPGEFVHSMGNTHVYSNHIEPLKTQIERTPRPFPVLQVNPDVKDIDGFKASDFKLVGYNPHAKIAMDMAV